MSTPRKNNKNREVCKGLQTIGENTKGNCTNKEFLVKVSVKTKPQEKCPRNKVLTKTKEICVVYVVVNAECIKTCACIFPII